MLLIKETFVEVQNKGEDNESRTRLYTSDLHEPFTDDTGKLFRSLQGEYGKCISKMYHDDYTGSIGWVFEKKVKYTDCNEYYLLEAWITLYDGEAYAGKGYYPAPEFQNVQYHCMA